MIKVATSYSQAARDVPTFRTLGRHPLSRPTIALTSANSRREHAGMVLASLVTADRRYVVYVHARQQAELAVVNGIRRTTILGPAPLYRVTDRLVELGYTDADLISE